MKDSLASNLKYARTGHPTWKQTFSSKHFKFSSLCFFHKHTQSFQASLWDASHFSKNMQNVQEKFHKHFGSSWSLWPLHLITFLTIPWTIKWEPDYQWVFGVPANYNPDMPESLLFISKYLKDKGHISEKFFPVLEKNETDSAFFTDLGLVDEPCPPTIHHVRAEVVEARTVAVVLKDRGEIWGLGGWKRQNFLHQIHQFFPKCHFSILLPTR